MNFTKRIAAVALGLSLLVSSFNRAASAASYTVQKGDTLSKIASKYGTSYTNIMKLSGLSSTIIYPGQKLTVSGTATTSTSTPSSTYTVQKGDTLSKIAARYGTTYTNIMQLNNLSSTVIRVGQKLKVTGTVATKAKASTATTASGSKLVSVARQHLGVKYTYGGSSPSTGFDCSGFVTYVLNQAGKSTARKIAAGNSVRIDNI